METDTIGGSTVGCFETKCLITKVKNIQKTMKSNNFRGPDGKKVN
jgi:hypothetical protein